MTPGKIARNKQDSSVIDDDNDLLEQAIETQFQEHPDYHVIELYEDDDFPECD